MNYEAITSILNDGLVLATGCTEPGALALTAAAAAAHLGEEVKSIHTFASGNIIKNAYSAGIPGTSLVGIEYAVAIGAIVAQPEKQLQVINGITSEQLEKACALVDAGHFPTENPIAKTFAEHLGRCFPTVTAMVSEDHRDCIQFV